MALDQNKGVWKSAKGKGRRTPKGRQFEDESLNEVKSLSKPTQAKRSSDRVFTSYSR